MVSSLPLGHQNEVWRPVQTTTWHKMDAVKSWSVPWLVPWRKVLCMASPHLKGRLWRFQDGRWCFSHVFQVSMFLCVFISLSLSLSIYIICILYIIYIYIIYIYISLSLCLCGDCYKPQVFFFNKNGGIQQSSIVQPRIWWRHTGCIIGCSAKTLQTNSGVIN